jgi:hypothetical protein
MEQEHHRAGRAKKPIEYSLEDIRDGVADSF